MRLVSDSMLDIVYRQIFCVSIMMILAGCGFVDIFAAEQPAKQGDQVESGVQDRSLVSDSKAAKIEEYKLGSGDKLKVVVFGENSLSGTYEIDGSGNLSIPLVGKVSAKESTVGVIEKEIIVRLQKFLKSPQVTVQVLNYRPFYILGEIKKPGNYPYVSGISVLNAVAMAGGFTYRADKGDIVIKRGGASARDEDVTIETVVLPGDIITVNERFF